MSRAAVYLDTNILIYLLEGDERYAPFIAERLQAMADDGCYYVTAAITVTEFLANNASGSLETLHKVPQLQILPLDEELTAQAAILQRNHPVLRIGDALHLATAQVAQCRLFFTDDKEFAKVIGNYIAVQPVQ